ncbi:MAG: 4,5-dihydroxyphthalate decarboxylase [Pigmentiphaga sp.]|nr:4,5-dihydroxyphthalate decarboxylase [Pigmentiphaga sp.]
MNPLELTMAIGPYDHVRGVTDGSIRVEGVSLRTLDLPIEEIFHRFTLHREWDITEMSMGKYASLVGHGDTSVAAIPVFVSRAFRLSMFYVREDSPLRGPRDLAGLRIGLPEWAQTACIYGRGYLSDYAGLRLSDMRWFQAGVNEAGRIDKVRMALPDGVSYTTVPDASLNDMLMDGELDVVMTARAPRDVGQGIRRLIPDYRTAEEQYFRETGIFPIMHVLVIKRDVIERHPWVAMNLYKAFAEAKKRSLERLADITASYAPMPWLAHSSEAMASCFGDDFFPYGVGPETGGAINRRTLAAFLRYATEQGVSPRPLEVDALFPRSVLPPTFRV